MTEWPPITGTALLERLAFEDEQLVKFLLERARTIPQRTLDDAAYERATGYPWQRTSHSYVLSGGELSDIDEVPELGPEPRFPLLAIGSNAAPSTLRAKLGEEASVAVVMGRLRDFDVGPAASPTFYGSFAATLFESPGAEVETALLWVTAEQLSAIATGEVSYYFGRLDDVCFSSDVAGAEPVSSVYAFVSRLGVHCVDGAPVALAAVPASGRRARAMTQEELLDRVAALLLEDGMTARDLVHAIFEDYGSFVDRAVGVLRPLAQPFESARFTRFPA